MKITKAQIEDILIRTAKTAFIVAISAFVTAWASTGMADVEAALITAGSTVGTFILNIIVKLIKNLIDDWRITPDELTDIFGEGEEDADI